MYLCKLIPDARRFFQQFGSGLQRDRTTPSYISIAAFVVTSWMSSLRNSEMDYMVSNSARSAIIYGISQ